MIAIHEIELMMINSALEQKIALGDVLFEANGKVYEYKDGKIVETKEHIAWSSRVLMDINGNPNFLEKRK